MQAIDGQDWVLTRDVVLYFVDRHASHDTRHRHEASWDVRLIVVAAQQFVGLQFVRRLEASQEHLTTDDAHASVAWTSERPRPAHLFRSQGRQHTALRKTYLFFTRSSQPENQPLDACK